MKKFTTQQIRDSFINFFKKYDHTHVSSSSLVPHNDPSLMFVNSGMVQFKDVFTGLEQRDYKRAVSTQKSVRAGGKHNDLENVGYTARHHTFFEMLGNFSFGDYFKEEAIKYAWDLTTKELCLDKNKIYVTVYHDDEEARSYWKKITGFGDDKIISIATDDNFWSMGSTGPCGPCSEIFYDHGASIKGGLPGTPDEDGDRYIEIWNLVFMQYEQKDKDTRVELPKKSVDTGMGLERVSAVIQGVQNNYEIDMFQDLINCAESILNVKAEGEKLFSYRVIADHLRSASFLIADGVMPSNEGRGYVLRRIMRRAMKHAHQLGSKDALMYQLFPKLVDLFGCVFPEIKRSEHFISNILKQEEERFKNTLDKGLLLLEEELSNISKFGILSGETAFKLYDTYGFPLDLTEDIVKKQDITVNKAEFEKKMLEQKERARKSWIGSGESKTDSIWFNIMSEFGETEFLGYKLEKAEAKILALVKNGNRLNKISNKGESFTLISNQTPFYGESGGQVGDIGFITTVHGAKIKVINSLKYFGKIIGHICELESGDISLYDVIKLEINVNYRNNLRINHTATHILHAVLRDVLGPHVMQKGSLVAEDKLRFDISHPSALTRDQINLVEKKINHIIRQNSSVSTHIMSKEEAIEQGAVALFGEKYDSEVRVVSLNANQDNKKPYSFELCGGTHVERAGDIGLFKITNNFAIAAGIRRIEAVCGDFALSFISRDQEILNQATSILNTEKNEIISKIDNLIGTKKDLEKQVENLQIQKITISDNQLAKYLFKIKTVNLLYRYFDKTASKIMRVSAENLVKKHHDLIAVYVSKELNKLSIIVAVSQQISRTYNAGAIAKEISAFLGGSGGGRPTLAQAGGSDLAKFDKIQDKIISYIKSI